MAAQQQQQQKAGRLSPQDPNSFSRPDQAKVEHVFVRLDVDFDKKVVAGHVVLTVSRKSEDVSHVILDSKDLSISKAVDDSTGKELDFVLGEEGFVGSKLQVQLPPQTEEGQRVKVKLFYSTTEKCSALQWLDQMQTAGKERPYMFSQNQAIHCRTMIPCQDTPCVKTPYTAEISAPSDLTVLMSAIREGEPSPLGEGRTLHKFRQTVPVQSYLIAIAVGRLESRKIGPRSQVWSEKEFVDAAADEFSETEVMLRTAEEICGPYIWNIYDILVLPPSFPYGGMENPCLTFATPTLLAGDKSLACVIAHEIAHSWTGNLVTNKNFEHFWLNEGFTVFTERKIVGRMKGEHLKHLEASIGWKDLKNAVQDLGEKNPLTSLVVDLTGVDPDDAFSTVPYEKGFTFLWYLEQLVGGPGEFEPFLRKYYEAFKFQSIDSDQFKLFFLDHFKSVAAVDSIEWERWFKEPGMPFYQPQFDETLAKACRDLKNEWLAWDVSSDCPMKREGFANLMTEQKIEFLSQMVLEDPLGVQKLEKMEQLYGMNAINNSEIKFLWIRLGLKGRWEDAVGRALKMVTEQGRMKFVRPLYRDLYAWEDKRQLAIDTFVKNKPHMMKVAIQGVNHDLKLS